ncbi:glycosyltransferase family 4 protein [Aureimonas leprariae]|uniref:Glycosyltransferase family 4 protein n=1 Tax=Plantimonas leprariae TaxID=2615207 RepID=A0A7V7PM90_9HYPH|nr:glycosyltransferase family 4 protein [Aureimonas leprariae]KAB0677756.1 glycosyltransferase family 4 protein [Aureimonas leprariae]
MRVAFHAPMKAPDDPVPSGEGRMARLFMEAIRRAGCEVELASRFRAYEGAGDAGRQREIAAEGAREAERLVARYRALRQAERPALWFTYHLYHKAPDHLGPAVAGALGIPYVVAEASHAPKQRNGRWAAGYHAAESAIRLADRIWCINPVDRACLLPIAKPGALRDLPPFIDTAPFRAGDRATARRWADAAFGLDPDAPLILTVAMMRADQKLESYRVLADALGRVEKRRWNALVVGDGPAEAEVRRSMQPLGGRVAFAGRLTGDDLVRAYRAADIYAWPSVKEAVGMSFIEAASAGVAVVAGRSGGIDHVVEDGRTGLVVPAGDAAVLAEGIAVLLDDPARAHRMGEAGAARAVEVNDVEAAARMLAADIRQLVAAR